VLLALICFLAFKTFSWVGVPRDMKKFLGVSSWERNFGGGHCYGLLFEKYLLILNGLSAITGGFVSR